MSERALTYEQLLLLEPDAIRELYPFGAKEWKKRWIPVLEGDEADRPLKRLLKDKKATTHTRRLLHRDSSRGYTDDPGQAMKVRPDPGEAVDELTQKRYSEEARGVFNERQGSLAMTRLIAERDELKVLVETYRSLARAKGVDIRSDLRVVERRLEALDRKLGVQRAA